MTTLVLTCKTLLEHMPSLRRMGRKSMFTTVSQSLNGFCRQVSRHLYLDSSSQHSWQCLISVHVRCSIAAHMTSDIPLCITAAFFTCTHFCKTHKESNTSGLCPVMEGGRVVTIHFGANITPAMLLWTFPTSQRIAYNKINKIGDSENENREHTPLTEHIISIKNAKSLMASGEILQIMRKKKTNNPRLKFILFCS
jgi:hypothetical protein